MSKAGVMLFAVLAMYLATTKIAPVVRLQISTASAAHAAPYDTLQSALDERLGR